MKLKSIGAPLNFAYVLPDFQTRCGFINEKSALLFNQKLRIFHKAGAVNCVCGLIFYLPSFVVHMVFILIDQL